MGIKSAMVGLLLTAITVVQAEEQQAGVEGQYHNPEVLLQQIHQSKQVGPKIYQAFCQVCHDPKPVIALGAPRRGNVQDWQLRCQHGLQVLLQRIDEGVNNMPPRGGCFECTDDDLRQATLYMVPTKVKGCRE
jgi:cytochrome c5